ncbi:hypothetical protein DEA8626_03467 [Defluviimonas aquaemixtae]|uniref:Uncharacterized protein n=1 Tax=Albidovulum aquaemixtae TaxID=1542388 RepID=A0A2R8BLX2_9RHOB|nr:hypothetical protein [Defluviimonas aquaemixtae]SPH24415.1 hypothetical protein DEA8626_03467 [Defluviimonas aquaemixtae]
MNNPAQIWGTVSVRDHLRPRAFVAELVLFEALVIPRPPLGATWPEEWDPAHQDEVLSWIPRDRLMEVSWDDKQHMEWEKRKIAADAEMDVADLQQQPGFEEAQRNEDFDAPAFHLTRRVLQDFVDAERNRALIKGVPRTEVAVIPAYDGPQAFLDDAPKQERLLRAFGWEFLIPHHETTEGKQRSHQDQIKAALDLCTMPEVQAHRLALRAWTSVEALRGTTTEEARERMEALVEAYAKAVAASKIPVRLKWGAGIAEFFGAIAALLINPAFALVGPAIKLGETAAEPHVERAMAVPDAVKPAGLIHAMREEFANAHVVGLAFNDRPKIRIEDHWPHGAPTLFL